MHKNNKNVLFINKLRTSSGNADDTKPLAHLKLDYLLTQISQLEVFQQGPLSRSQSYASILTLIRLVKTEKTDTSLLSLITIKANNAGRLSENLFKINAEFSNELTTTYLKFTEVVKSLVNDTHKLDQFKNDLDKVLEKFKILDDEYQENLKTEDHRKSQKF